MGCSPGGSGPEPDGPSLSPAPVVELLTRSLPGTPQPTPNVLHLFLISWLRGCTRLVLRNFLWRRTPVLWKVIVFWGFVELFDWLLHCMTSCLTLFIIVVFTQELHLRRRTHLLRASMHAQCVKWLSLCLPRRGEGRERQTMQAPGGEEDHHAPMYQASRSRDQCSFRNNVRALSLREFGHS